MTINCVTFFIFFLGRNCVTFLLSDNDELVQDTYVNCDKMVFQSLRIKNS